METPTRYTTLRHLRQVDEIQKKAARIKSKDADNILKAETSKNINFGVTYIIYKNLLPLNVNDFMLPSQNVFHTKSFKKIDTVSPPDICEFLNEMVPLSYFVSEPEICPEIDFQRRTFDVYKMLSVGI